MLMANQPLLRNWPKKQTIRPLRSSRSFNVTEFGTNRKPICHFLLMNSTNLPPILHRFQVMADYWSNFRYRWRVLRFNAPAGGDPCEYPDKLHLFRN